MTDRNGTPTPLQFDVATSSRPLRISMARLSGGASTNVVLRHHAPATPLTPLESMGAGDMSPEPRVLRSATGSGAWDAATTSLPSSASSTSAYTYATSRLDGAASVYAVSSPAMAPLPAAVTYRHESPTTTVRPVPDRGGAVGWARPPPIASVPPRSGHVDDPRAHRDAVAPSKASGHSLHAGWDGEKALSPRFASVVTPPAIAPAYSGAGKRSTWPGGGLSGHGHGSGAGAAGMPSSSTTHRGVAIL